MSYDRNADVIAVGYTDGTRRLQLYEQSGRLDSSVLTGFRQWEVPGARVWLREGQPTIVTWDRDDIVYTIVSDAELSQIAEALQQLPTTPSDGQQSPFDRIGGGLRQMTTWAAA